MPGPLDNLEEAIRELQDLYDDPDIVIPASQLPEKENPYKDFEDRNPMAGGGMLVQPSADGSRPGYADKSGRETVHLVNETGNPNHSGIYRTTNLNSGKITYRGGYTRRNEGESRS